MRRYRTGPLPDASCSEDRNGLGSGPLASRYTMSLDDSMVSTSARNVVDRAYANLNASMIFALPDRSCEVPRPSLLAAATTELKLASTTLARTAAQRKRFMARLSFSDGPNPSVPLSHVVTDHAYPFPFVLPLRGNLTAHGAVCDAASRGHLSCRCYANDVPGLDG